MLHALRALLIKDFMSAYGKTPLGVLWAVAEPVIGICLLTVVFSQISHTAPMGSSYPLFYATGYLPYLFFTSVHGKVMTGMRQSSQMTAHPHITFVSVMLSKMILQTLIMSCVMVVVYGGVWAIYAPPEEMNVSVMALFIVLATFLASGIGMFNAGLVQIFPPWEKVWGIMMRPLFLISGVFYPYAAMPPNLQNILWWNPVLHLVGLNREAVYQGYEGGYISVGYVGGLALISMTLGVVMLRIKKG